MSRKRLVLHALVFVITVIALVPGSAPGAQEERPGASPSPTPSPAPSPSPTGSKTAKSIVVPPAEKAKTNPVSAVPAAIESGRTLFLSQCGMCHGSKGDGRGDLAQSLKLKVPDFTETRVQSHRTDGELFYIMTHGHGEMPPEKRLPDQQKWEIVLFIRTLGRGAAPKP